MNDSLNTLKGQKVRHRSHFIGFTSGWVCSGVFFFFPRPNQSDVQLLLILQWQNSVSLNISLILVFTCKGTGYYTLKLFVARFLCTLGFSGNPGWRRETARVNKRVVEKRTWNLPQTLCEAMRRNPLVEENWNAAMTITSESDSGLRYWGLKLLWNNIITLCLGYFMKFNNLIKNRGEKRSPLFEDSQREYPLFFQDTPIIFPLFAVATFGENNPRLSWVYRAAPTGEKTEVCVHLKLNLRIITPLNEGGEVSLFALTAPCSPWNLCV